MAAEASRAPRLRERGSIALPPAALAGPPSDDRYDGPALRIFATVPARHGVIAAVYDAAILRRGEVAVYDEMALSQEGLVHGAVYVIEHQRPVASMPMYMFREMPDPRMDVSRSIVIAARHSRLDGRWVAHPLRARQRGCFICSDGPYDDVYLMSKIIGRVVGIYNPAAIGGAA